MIIEHAKYETVSYYLQKLVDIIIKKLYLITSIPAKPMFIFGCLRSNVAGFFVLGAK